MKKRWRHSPLYIRIMNSREYKEARAAYLSKHPLCEICEAKGFYDRRPTQLHHIREVESGRTEAECWQLGISPSNFQALCEDCHNEVHRARHSHSREAHQQREHERAQQWLDRRRKKKGTV